MKLLSEKDIKTIDSLYLQGSEIKGKRREELNNKVKYLKNLNKHFILQPRDISILQEDITPLLSLIKFLPLIVMIFSGFYNKLILEKINIKWYVIDDATKPLSQ